MIQTKPKEGELAYITLEAWNCAAWMGILEFKEKLITFHHEV
jgi:hypothetical protein